MMNKMMNGFKNVRNQYVRAGGEPAKTHKLYGKWRQLSLLSLLGLLLVGGTFAMLTAIVAPRLNAFGFGNTTETIEEEFDGWNYKRVALKIEDKEENVPSVVRAMIIPVLKNRENLEQGTSGALIAMPDPTGRVSVSMGGISFEFTADWEDAWFYKDGYFYYKKVLNPGEQTPYLLQRVTSSNPEIIEIDKYSTVTVEVLSDALQASGGAPEEAWGVYVKDGKVYATPQP